MTAVGPTASAYALPAVSVTVLTWFVVSFHPTTTTFKLPVVCAPLNGTPTDDCGDCGHA